MDSEDRKLMAKSKSDVKSDVVSVKYNIQVSDPNRELVNVKGKWLEEKIGSTTNTKVKKRVRKKRKVYVYVPKESLNLPRSLLT